MADSNTIVGTFVGTVAGDDDSDAGARYEVRCPTCRDVVIVSDHAWWTQQCSCGYAWRVEMTAVGTKKQRR